MISKTCKVTCLMLKQLKLTSHYFKPKSVGSGEDNNCLANWSFSVCLSWPAFQCMYLCTDWLMGELFPFTHWSISVFVSVVSRILQYLAFGMQAVLLSSMKKTKKKEIVFFLNFYCYSITVVCLFSPSLHPSWTHLPPPPPPSPPILSICPL